MSEFLAGIAGIVIGVIIVLAVQGYAMTRSDRWALAACAVLTGVVFTWLLWEGTGR
jgi:hypothetical protein